MFGNKQGYQPRVDERQIVRDDPLHSSVVDAQEWTRSRAKLEAIGPEGKPVVHYTIESPAHEGYYWWRARGSKAPEPQGWSRVQRHALLGLAVLEHSPLRYRPVDSYNREWAGPLAEPVG